MKTQEKPSFYVGIKNSKELRRNLLEASKSVINSMQKQQRVTQIRLEKNRLNAKLREDVKELKMLFSKLEKTLPEHVFENSQKTDAKRQSKKPSLQKPTSNQNVYESEKEIDNINSQLEMIEQRLKNIKK